MLEDFVAAAKWLKARPDSTGKLGAVGFCFGGGIVKRIQAKRFTPSMLGEGREIKKEYLDAVSEGGRVAIYVEARDLHSVSARANQSSLSL